MVERFLVPAEGADTSAIHKALQITDEFCAERGRQQDVVLLIPTKHNIDRTTLSSALGERASRALLDGKKVSLPSNSTVRLQTERTCGGWLSGDVFLVVYATKKLLDLVDGAATPAAIIVVPWVMKDVEDWRKTWNPVQPGEPPAQSSDDIANRVVLEGLESLTISVNLGTGLSHPSDEDHAKQLFLALVASEEMYDPAAVRRWALRNGWTPRGADQLREVADKALRGVRMRIGSRPYRTGRDYVEALRKRVAERQQ